MQYNMDGYQSALLGDRRRRNGIGALDYAEVYARGGVAARIIDLPADTAMSRGVEVDGDQEGTIKGEFDRLDVVGNMSDALRWSRLDGGSAIMMLTDTGQLDEPLPDSFGRINELRVIELSQLQVAPGGYYNDPNLDNYGQPEIYQVTPLNAGNSGRGFFYVHESRILPVYGDPLPARIRSYLQVPWAGRSAATRPFDAISKWGRALYLALEILKRKQQAVHRMKGLADLIQEGMEDVVRKRVDLVDEVRSLMNGVAVDSEDDYQVYDQNVSGLKELIGEFQVAVSAESGIPVTLLFGRSAAGLNSTGDNDLEGFYDLCEGLQKTSAQPALERLVDAILRQSSLQGARPNADQWSITWPSLWTPTDAEQAETRFKNAQAEQAESAALNSYAESGVMSNEDVRRHLIEQGRYGLSNAE